MSFRLMAVVAIACIGVQPAFANPFAQCSLNADKSKLVLNVSNGSADAFACTASCKYTIASERPLRTLDCNYSLAANTSDKVACDVDGDGPGYFAEVRPTRFVCQPR